MKTSNRMLERWFFTQNSNEPNLVIYIIALIFQLIKLQ